MHDPVDGLMKPVLEGDLVKIPKGRCVLSIGEVVLPYGETSALTVFAFQKGKLVVRGGQLRVGQEIQIKDARFVVESRGDELSLLRGLPGTVLERVGA